MSCEKCAHFKGRGKYNIIKCNVRDDEEMIIFITGCTYFEKKENK